MKMKLGKICNNMKSIGTAITSVVHELTQLSNMHRLEKEMSKEQLADSKYGGPYFIMKKNKECP